MLPSPHFSPSFGFVRYRYRSGVEHEEFNFASRFHLSLTVRRVDGVVVSDQDLETSERPTYVVLRVKRMPQERLRAQQTANSSLLDARCRRHRMMGASVKQQQNEQSKVVHFSWFKKGEILYRLDVVRSLSGRARTGVFLLDLFVKRSCIFRRIKNNGACFL